MDDAPSSRSELSPLGRTIHSLALLVITGATLLGVAIAGTSWRLCSDLWSPPAALSGSPFTSIALPIAVGLLVATAGGLAIYFTCRWQTVVASAAVPIALLGFVAFDNGDDVQVRLGPRMERSDPFYEKLMWLSDTAPSSRRKEFGKRGQFDWLKLPEDSGKWPAFAALHRETILRSWAEQKVGREWIEAMRTTPSPGVWRASIGSHSINFSTLRFLNDLVGTRAMLLAADGSRDEAIASLDEWLQALGKFQRSSPGLGPQIVVSTMQDRTCKTLRRLLRDGKIPAEARPHLMETLGALASPPQRVRLAVEGEVECALSVIEQINGANDATAAQLDVSDSWMSSAARHGGRLFFHPRRTRTFIATTLRQIETSATDRARLARVADPAGPEGFERFRNPVGHQLYAMMFPAMSKIVRRWWEFDDARVALIAELKETTAK